jgi:hypothetical protein
MEGRPFALLGVNCDYEKQTLQQVVFHEQLNWQNWWNGGSTGPFTALYDVQSFPTLFVLDSRGVIRYRIGRGEDLERAVETLLREVEPQRPQ